jgi:hypothetical protein
MLPNPQTAEKSSATFSVTKDDPNRPLPGQPFEAPPGQVTAKALAPNCVKVAFEEGVIGTNLWVYVANRFDQSYRINLIVSGAPDSGCFSIDPGQWYKWSFTGFNVSLDRVELC